MSLDFLGRPRERGRIRVQGQSTDDSSYHTLLVIHEADSSWTIHGLGASRVWLPGAKVSAALRWGVSPLDWCSHAIDEQNEHPAGVFTAECGPLLPRKTTTLRRGSAGLSARCARKQLAAALTSPHTP